MLAIRRVSRLILGRSRVESELPEDLCTVLKRTMNRLVKKLAVKSDVLLENFKPGSKPISLPLTHLNLKERSTGKMGSRASRFTSFESLLDLHESEWVRSNGPLVIPPRICFGL